MKIAPDENDPYVLAKVEDFKKELPAPCRLCGEIGSDGIVGVYRPPTKDLPRFGAPKGKDMFFLYRLCPLCAENPDYPRQIEEKLYSECHFNRGNLNLDVAVEAYSKGMPVVVCSAEGSVIHGQETLQAMIELGTPLKCATIYEVSVDDWNNSDWPEVLEAARRVFMERGGFELKR